VTQPVTQPVTQGDEPATEPERAIFLTAAALLEQGRVFEALSLLLSAGALAALLLVQGGLSAQGVLALALLSGFAQAYVALRVRFDAALFQALADGRYPAGLRDLDAALTMMRLRPSGKAGRPASGRALGAKGLLLRQALLVLLQLAFLLGSTAL